MNFTEQNLDTLSTLARIEIEADKKQKMLQDIQAILGHISEINAVEIEGTQEQVDIFNVVREDVITNDTGSKTASIMANAPFSQDGYVEVVQVLK